MKRIALAGATLVTGLGIAACGSPVAQTQAPPAHATTTVTATPGAISGAFNINADWQVSGGPVPGGTAHPCVGTGDLEGVQPGADIEVRPSEGSDKKNSYTTSLGNGIAETGVHLSLPGVVTAGFATPQICQFDFELDSLPAASQYQVTIFADGKLPGPFKVNHIDDGGPPNEITLDPQTTSVIPTTTTTAPPITTTTTDPLAALRAWWTGVGTPLITQLANDLPDEGTPGLSLPVLQTDCNQLASDVAKAQSAAPIPDPDLQEAWSDALSDISQGATLCIAASNDGSVSEATQSSAIIVQGAQETAAAINPLKARLGLS